MKNMVIGTAGHIDHGKTTLIKHLTGIETDTTAEEKKRGMSINLGFAYLDLPNNQRIGIVDVPGHEKFIKNMVAGLPGLNLTLLVIDAGEGIMPQTKEHIDILTLLGMKDFLIVLTKVKTVDREMIDLVVSDIREQLVATPLADAQIIETDALAGVGLAELKSAIQEQLAVITYNDKQSAARLNVDRVFSVKGFGTVVTGTLVEGKLAVGDELVCLPSYQKTKIRTIQVHEESVKEATAGQRTALNLANIKTDEIKRGDVLTLSNQLELSWMLDARVSCLAKQPKGLDLWERVRFLTGTKEVMARVVPIGTDKIYPGGEGFVQFRLEETLALKQGDRFIIRAYSPMVTIGGGVVLDANPQKHKRFKEQVVASLQVRDQGSVEELVLEFLTNKTDPLTALREVATYLDQDQSQVESICAGLEEMGAVRSLGGFMIAESALERLETKALSVLNNYHKVHRLRAYMPLEEFRSKADLGLTPKKQELLMKSWAEAQVIKLTDQGIASGEFTISLNDYHEREKARMLKQLLSSGFLPLKEQDLVNENKNAAEVIEVLSGAEVIYLTHEYVIARKYFEEAIAIVKRLGLANGTISLADFRNATASSRKASMLILEQLDKLGITKRVESVRELVNK